MDVERVNCPACGAKLETDGSSEWFRCEYCGNTIRIQRRKAKQDDRVTIQDSATGTVIGTVQMPAEYKTVGMLLPSASSYTYPFGVSAAASADAGTVISYFVGEAFCDRSRCPLLSGIYSQGLEQVSRTHYKDFMDVRQYADAYMSMYGASAKASSIQFIEERPMPLYSPFDGNAALADYKRKLEFEKQRTGNANMAKDLGYYLQGVCRVYSMTAHNTDFRLAFVTVVEGWKYQFLGAGSGLADIGSALGNAFGGILDKNTVGGLGKALFGNSILGRALSGNSAQPQTQAQPRQPQSTTHAFNDMPLNSVIDWQADGIFILQCLPSEFEHAFKGAFTDFCSTFKLDMGIREKMFNMQAQIQQDVARHTQQRVDQMNRQFQSWQQVHATQQAAFDSYNKAWWDRTNTADAARRSAYQSRMASEDRTSSRFSEAIRGVNTYVRDDGTEVEVSVAYDRAYTNHAGDTLGSNSAFEPGGNWTEMHKKP